MLYIGSEVILANLLYLNDKNFGITIDDMLNYCAKLKSELNKENIKYVIIDINCNELDNTLLKYNNEFRKFQDKYYIKKPINVRYFNSIFSPEIATVIEKVAKNLIIEG